MKYRLFLIAGLLLLILSWASYSGNASHTLLLWDDAAYVTNNTWITNPSLDGVSSLFTESKVSNWHPLTWLSYIPEYYFCETNAYCYKSTNIFLHATNSFLVFLLSGLVFYLLMPGGGGGAFRLSELAGRNIFPASLMSGILFCVHPQHAESVIWVAERKDLLSALFYLLALVFYIYQRISAASKKKLLPFVFFILAVMSKSMAITLPAVLILLDFTLLGRRGERSGELPSKAIYRIAIVEKMHYHIVAILVAIITLLSQSVDTIDQPSLLDMVIISIAAIEHYLISFVAPINLSPFYPVEIVSTSVLEYWPLVIVPILLLSCMFSKKYGSLAILFTGYFLITLSPVIGIIKVGDQAFADRYTYLTMIGFYILVSYGVSKVFDANQRFRIPVLLGFSVLVSCLIFSTHQYKNTWRDDLTLWSAVQSHYPNTSVTVSNNMGFAFFTLGDYPTAKEYFEIAIDVDAHRPRAYANLAATYQQLGEAESFLSTYALGVENNPEDAGLISSAGFGFLAYNLDDQALDYFIKALELELEFPPALMGVGSLLIKRGELERAITMLELIPLNSDVDFSGRLLLAQAYGHSDKIRSLIILDKLRAKYGRDEEIDPVMDFVNSI